MLLHASTVVTENVVATLFSSTRLVIMLPAALFPSQLFHGAGAVLPAAPKFTNTERVLASATTILKFAVVDAPLLSVATTVRE